jgi:hypothetical protein
MMIWRKRMDLRFIKLTLLGKIKIGQVVEDTEYINEDTQVSVIGTWLTAGACYQYEI